MTRRLLMALVALVAALVMAASASADATSYQRYGPWTGNELVAFQLAEAHYGAVPCNGNLVVTWYPLGVNNASFVAVSPATGYPGYGTALNRCVALFNYDTVFSWAHGFGTISYCWAVTIVVAQMLGIGGSTGHLPSYCNTRSPIGGYV